MFVWYAMLRAVIEAFEERRIELRGAFGEDVAAISDPLRQCRNAVFHVSRDRYHDARLFELMKEPGSAVTIRRVSRGFGRLFLDELDHWKMPPPAATDAKADAAPDA